jgi:Zn finger protein HypA/HybF involved in hydrogenase expression
MHEASLLGDLLRKVEEIAAAEKAVQVVEVSIWLGALTLLSAAHFTRHFEQTVTGTIAEGAQLRLTVSDDVGHVRAQDIVLESVELETAAPSSSI